MRKIGFYAVLTIIALTISTTCTADSSRHSNFVDVGKSIPSAIIDMRYYDSHNFVGRRVKGYERPICLLTKEAGDALKDVAGELKGFGLKLRIFDCYRPQSAVNDFAKWARDPQDIRTKVEFYPEVDKSDLFSLGYIAMKSGHSRGSTVDLTIDGVDMGTPFDFFGPVSHPKNPKFSEQIRANRLLLRSLMERYGFKPLDEEWWHFTLKEEPYPDTYFDFPVK